MNRFEKLKRHIGREVTMCEPAGTFAIGKIINVINTLVVINLGELGTWRVPPAFVGMPGDPPDRMLDGMFRLATTRPNISTGSIIFRWSEKSASNYASSWPLRNAAASDRAMSWPRRKKRYRGQNGCYLRQMLNAGG
jgi:hypothetical protein